MTPQIDKSEYTFLLHRSLEGQIQGDHYRSFTDVNARERLLGLVWRDQRCIPIPKGLRQVLIRRWGDHAEVSCRNKDIGQAQTFTLRFTASEDGVAVFRAPYGAVFQVEEIKKKEEKGAENKKDGDVPRESSGPKH